MRRLGGGAGDRPARRRPLQADAGGAGRGGAVRRPGAHHRGVPARGAGPPAPEGPALERRRDPRGPGRGGGPRARKGELEGHIRRRLAGLRAEEARLAERARAGEETGRALLARLRQEAAASEVDKFSLHVEEMDKIASLLLGLSSRLARTENGLALVREQASAAWDEGQERALLGKKEKLEQQLEEAKALKRSIDRRSVAVSAMVQARLGSALHATYTAFQLGKVQGLLDRRLLQEATEAATTQLGALQGH